MGAIGERFGQVHPGIHAIAQPDKPAVIHAATGTCLTYAQLDAASNRLAHLLHDAGLRRGDHVAAYLENSFTMFEIIWACLRSGLCLTPINFHLPATEAAFIVDNCDAQALIASARLDQSAELGRLAGRCALKLAAGGAIAGFDCLERAIADKPVTPIKNESMGSMMMYSSGTTGRPKGIWRDLPDVALEEGNPHFNGLIAMYRIDRDTIYLSPAPLYHAAPLGWTSAVVQAGGTVVFMDRFEPEPALAAIERYRVTHSQWVPTMFIRMLKLDEQTKAKYDLSGHRHAIHAAAPCPVEVKRQMIAWWGPISEESYSSTEGAGLTMIASKDWLSHPGSVGRAVGAPLHVCDEEGRELPPGKPGLIYGELQAGRSFSYYKDEAKTIGSMHPLHHNWRTIGDIGYLDEEGWLYLTDRKDFMIISGGVNIYPQQIEDALALHPAVSDVAVIGVPNEDLGEEVKAVVQPAPGVVPSSRLAREIMDFVTARLGRKLTPRSVDFVDEFPRLPTGKLAKAVLRERYWGKASS
ncbi:MAG: acyl-CoA synthetase [Novosphingobium sp.]|nr:acyl-CoA synthetase [Novosphingobium sp.]